MTTPRKATEKFDPTEADERALNGDYDHREVPNGLADALLNFQAEMPSIFKAQTGDAGSYKYKYADLADISKQITPLLCKHGLVFSTKPRRTENGDYELVGILRHGRSGEYDEGSLPIIGRKSQEIGSSLTYNRRYLLGCMTGVITDSDDDGRTSNQTTQRTSHPSPQQVAQKRVSDTYGRYVEDRAWQFSDLASRYESDYDRPIGTASPAELDAFADSLDAEIAQRNAQAAAGAAQRALGAEQVTP